MLKNIVEVGIKEKMGGSFEPPGGFRWDIGPYGPEGIM